MQKYCTHSSFLLARVQMVKKAEGEQKTETPFYKQNTQRLRI